MEFMIDNSVGFLQEYCQKRCLPLPIYNDVAAVGNDHCKQFTVSCKFENYTVQATSNSKKGAKKDAAKNMVLYLRDKDYFTKPQVNEAPTIVVKTDTAPEVVDAPVKESVNIQSSPEATGNPIGNLQEYCVKKQMSLPVYNEVVGESKTFKMACVVDGITTYGTGAQKKIAKSSAAQAMLKAVKEGVIKVRSQPVSIREEPINIKEPVKKQDVLDTESLPKKEEVSNTTSKITQNGGLSNNEAERLRKVYHKLSNKDPEKWLQAFCDSRDIDISNFSARPTKPNEKKIFAIEIPSESIELQWDGDTIEEAKKGCCRVAGFMLLMKHIKEYKSYLKKNDGNNNNGRGRASGDFPKELKPFVHLENWLNVACKESAVAFPYIEYKLVGGFYHATCTLFTHTTSGTGESKKNARNGAVFKMQKQLIESIIDIKETDDDLVKSQKVVDLMVKINNDLQLARQVNLDDVVEAYKKLAIRSKPAGTSSSNGLYKAEYTCLRGRAVTEILNLNLDEEKSYGLEYIQALATEQKLILKIEHFDNITCSFYPLEKSTFQNSRKGKYVSIITIQKSNAQKLAFMSPGSTISESLQNAVVMALIQLKILLFSSSSEIENLIFLDSFKNVDDVLSKNTAS